MWPLWPLTPGTQGAAAALNLSPSAGVVHVSGYSQEHCITAPHWLTCAPHKALITSTRFLTPSQTLVIAGQLPQSNWHQSPPFTGCTGQQRRNCSGYHMSPGYAYATNEALLTQSEHHSPLISICSHEAQCLFKLQISPHTSFTDDHYSAQVMTVQPVQCTVHTLRQWE